MVPGVQGHEALQNAGVSNDIITTVQKQHKRNQVVREQSSSK